MSLRARPAFAQASKQLPGLIHGRMQACTRTYGAFRSGWDPPGNSGGALDCRESKLLAPGAPPRPESKSPSMIRLIKPCTYNPAFAQASGKHHKYECTPAAIHIKPCICSGEPATPWPESWKDVGVHVYLWCFPAEAGPPRASSFRKAT